MPAITGSLGRRAQNNGGAQRSAHPLALRCDEREHVSRAWKYSYPLGHAGEETRNPAGEDEFLIGKICWRRGTP